jgi:hypothetical protein
MTNANYRLEKVDSLLSELREQILLMDSNHKGKRWEEEFASTCHHRGMVVEPPLGREDLRVNGLRVQCKHIDQADDAGRIDIRNRMKVQSMGWVRGYTASECDVFVLKHREEVFLIPIPCMCGEDGFAYRSVCVSSIQPFKEAWGVFDTGYVPPRRPVQSLLFHGDDERPSPSASRGAR